MPYLSPPTLTREEQRALLEAPRCSNTAYAPRRPQASPLYRVLSDHFESLERVHKERFERTHGPP